MHKTKEKFDTLLNFLDKHYNIFMYISLFVLLFYVFNISIRDYIFPNDAILGITLLFSTFTIFLLHFKEISRKKNNKKTLFIGLTVILLTVLFRNKDLANGHFGMPFFTTMALIVMYILSYSKRWYLIVRNVIIIYTMEHVIATWVFYFLPNFYRNNIIYLFPDFMDQLLYQFENRQMAGFTHHYSTNASYLVTGLLVMIFTFNFDFKNKKRTILNIVLVILNFGALLLTAKRAPLVFVIISVAIAFILKDIKKIKENIKKVILIFLRDSNFSCNRCDIYTNII